MKPSPAEPRPLPQSADVTQHLLAWSQGDERAFDALMPLVYEELRRLARCHLRREPGRHTLQTGGLVNEAYIRLVGQRRVDWHSRAHFFNVASRIMRRVLVDQARKRLSAKRGGGAVVVELEEWSIPGETSPGGSVLALNRALEQMALVAPELAQITEMRFFGGLTEPEIAEVLDISTSTVTRRWRLAKAWLHRHLA